jgi:DNA-binding response OmpR family regulator
MEQSQTSAKKILIVEDDTFMGNLLERKFKLENFEISRAGSVDEARKILESEAINLVLLDIILPGTDGLTYLKELKASPVLKDIPVIITSNLGQQEEIDSGIAMGATDYIVKAHATPGEIVHKVESILGK